MSKYINDIHSQNGLVLVVLDDCSSTKEVLKNVNNFYGGFYPGDYIAGGPPSFEMNDGTSNLPLHLVVDLEDMTAIAVDQGWRDQLEWTDIMNAVEQANK